MNENRAKVAYEAAVKKLQEFCEENTNLTVLVIDSQYPFCIQFFESPQLSMFENIDESGEVNYLTVTVGMNTDVKSTLKFKMNAKLLKKLIKLAETVGTIYYQAFREQAGELKTS